MRVLAVAHKSDPSPIDQFSINDEQDMVLIGFLALLDPVKPTTRSAIDGLHRYGVNVKILTGDNEKVARTIAMQVGLDGDAIIMGQQLDTMDDHQLASIVEKTTIFAKLSPQQKARVVKSLQNRGHCVGYMGDGINDAAAMKVSDVGISVDSAVDIAKESADVILLKKDLNVLEEGIIEGRKTYANMIKYIKMTASSNFGNMFSVLVASAFLPFLPMEALQLILLNLINDLCCTTIPWDNVDNDFLMEPRKWEAKSLARFMVWIGPTSSLFDILTFILLYFVICPSMCGGQMYPAITDLTIQTRFIALFQTGWFIESMLTQSLVIHMIRTSKLPFIQSHASRSVMVMTVIGIMIVIMIPMLPIGKLFGFMVLPVDFYGWLIVIIGGYMALISLVKTIYIRKYGSWL